MKQMSSIQSQANAEYDFMGTKLSGCGLAFPGNLNYGHTLTGQLEQVEHNVSTRPKEVITYCSSPRRGFTDLDGQLSVSGRCRIKVQQKRLLRQR